MTAQPRWQADAQAHNTLNVRDLRFRGAGRERGVDPVASAWFAALSASFPHGEAMFIDAVKAFRDDAPPKLAGEIRDFIRQEVNHSREHVAFNRAVSEAGYDTTEIMQRVVLLIQDTKATRPIVQLAITMALEHFTAIFARAFLSRTGELATAGMGDPDLWRWHAVEEIEHKAVAFDTWNHATRDWTDFKRWSVRCLLMLRVTTRFLRNRTRDSLELMRQDGIEGWRARWRLFVYLVYKPGILRRIFPAWLAYFRPGFHPWDHDDRYLIERWEAEQAMAVE